MNSTVQEKPASPGRHFCLPSSGDHAYIVSVCRPCTRAVGLPSRRDQTTPLRPDSQHYCAHMMRLRASSILLCALALAGLAAAQDSAAAPPPTQQSADAATTASLPLISDVVLADEVRMAILPDNPFTILVSLTWEGNPLSVPGGGWLPAGAGGRGVTPHAPTLRSHRHPTPPLAGRALQPVARARAGRQAGGRPPACWHPDCWAGAAAANAARDFCGPLWSAGRPQPPDPLPPPSLPLCSRHKSLLPCVRCVQWRPDQEWHRGGLDVACRRGRAGRARGFRFACPPLVAGHTSAVGVLRCSPQVLLAAPGEDGLLSEFTINGITTDSTGWETFNVQLSWEESFNETSEYDAT